MNQIEFFDIHESYRTGGIDWERMSKYKLVGIRAGVGTGKDELLEEHVQKSNEYKIAYFTYHIPTPDSFGTRVEEQVELYLSWPGVVNHRICLDVERPYSNRPDMCNSSEFQRYIRRVQSLINDSPMGYSNENNLKNALGMPKWVNELYWWVAQYYYQNGTDLYKYFSDWKNKYANQLPGFVRGTSIEKKTIAWQFSKKGNAQHYIANPTTNHPVYKIGIKSADLSISTIDESEFLQYFFVDTSGILTDKERMSILWREATLQGWNMEK